MKTEIYLRKKGGDYRKIVVAADTKVYHMTNKNAAVLFLEGDEFDVRIEVSKFQVDSYFKQFYDVKKKIERQSVRIREKSSIIV